ncbi:MAG: phenylalanine--tRNA ligase subunit alpha [Candidatus Desulfofervidus auxilii]|nr:phenylalanine--tRNA ligase subunit alpha [Candidatus Desulfofervidus auxilii]
MKNNFSEEIKKVRTSSNLEEVRIKFLGRKGELAKVMKELPSLPNKDKPDAGKVANKIKNFITNLLQQKQEELKHKGAEKGLIDITLPGREQFIGSLHPITITIQEICSVFKSLGFEIVTGPEIETDFYNFEALNIPKDHPARDMQDTLYISENILLRTHTSPLQIRTMLKTTPPVAAIAPGKVYRRDSDLTHSPMFHQIEGFLVDKDVNMGDLRGTLTYFVQQIFSSDTKVRFRPSFFPFTEPSAEVDISCVICNGSGFVDGLPCRVCKQTGWVEILGCGLIDPEVFKSVSYNPEKYSGFAFGLGVERVAMLKYGINDLRIFFENDIRFLNQFIDFPV